MLWKLPPFHLILGLPLYSHSTASHCHCYNSGNGSAQHCYNSDDRRARSTILIAIMHQIHSEIKMFGFLSLLYSRFRFLFQSIYSIASIYWISFTHCYYSYVWVFILDFFHCYYCYVWISFTAIISK